VPHPVLGQTIVLIATMRNGVKPDRDILLQACRQRLPAYMLPSHIELREGNLPRNPDGKIDRKLLAQQMQHLFMEANP
jgi:acyl-CoA synthetase (AMP-forming)/AMP-acid ligase II